MYSLIPAAKFRTAYVVWFSGSTSTNSGGRQADHVSRKSRQGPARDGIGMIRQILAIVFLDHLNRGVVVGRDDLWIHIIEQLSCNARMAQRIHGHWEARTL